MTPLSRTPHPDALAFIENDDAWEAVFSATSDQLRAMADAALADYEAERTADMDSDDGYLSFELDSEAE